MFRLSPTRRTATLACRLLQPAQQQAMLSSKEAKSGTAAPTTLAAAGAAAAAASAASSGNKSTKRQRLLAPLPLGQQPSSGGGRRVDGKQPSGKQPSGKQAGSGRGTAAAYKEPGPGRVLLPGGAQLTYRTDLLPAEDAAALFRTLRAELAWEQRSVHVMGRTVLQPRLIAYQADGPELSYTYSGATLAPAPWHPAVAALKARAEAAAGASFNCCLLNCYRSGADSLSWHSDNERLFGTSPTIASVSLGAPRDFLLRRNADHTDKYRFRLGGGALLVMGAGVQEGWMHSVPRRTGGTALGERISLTFRAIVAPEGRRGGACGSSSG